MIRRDSSEAQLETPSGLRCAAVILGDDQLMTINASGTPMIGPIKRAPVPSRGDVMLNYIGGATPRPTFTRGVCSVPSGCLTAAAMKMLAPAFNSLFSPGT